MTTQVLLGIVMTAMTVWTICAGSALLAAINAFVVGLNVAFALSIYWSRK